MIGVIVTGHGAFASGMTDSLQLLAGKQENYAYVDFTPDLSPDALSAALISAMESTGGDEYVVLCDLAGGTPFNVCVQLLERVARPMDIIAGANLPMIMAACFERDGQVVAALTPHLLETGRSECTQFILPELSDGDWDE